MASHRASYDACSLLYPWVSCRKKARSRARLLLSPANLSMLKMLQEIKGGKKKTKRKGGPHVASRVPRRPPASARRGGEPEVEVQVEVSL